MSTIHPRINVVMEKPLFERVSRLAEEDGVSLSLKVRDLVKEALIFRENFALLQLGKKREKTFKRSNALTHQQIWKSVQKKHSK